MLYFDSWDSKVGEFQIIIFGNVYCAEKNVDNICFLYFNVQYTKKP